MAKPATPKMTTPSQQDLRDAAEEVARAAEEARAARDAATAKLKEAEQRQAELNAAALKDRQARSRAVAEHLMRSAPRIEEDVQGEVNAAWKHLAATFSNTDLAQALARFHAARVRAFNMRLQVETNTALLHNRPPLPPENRPASLPDVSDVMAAVVGQLAQDLIDAERQAFNDAVARFTEGTSDTLPVTLDDARALGKPVVDAGGGPGTVTFLEGYDPREHGSLSEHFMALANPSAEPDKPHGPRVFGDRTDRTEGPPAAAANQ